ncbi:hypothetical protein CCP3SC15_2610002 [Gammaproteobacteria bacterium]
MTSRIYRTRIGRVWSSVDEEYTGWATLDALEMIALPNGATHIPWTVDETRVGAYGSNQTLIDPTRETIEFDASIIGTYKAEVRCYDGDTRVRRMRLRMD